jgi:predicted transposase YbfD/YdcC
MVSAWANKAGLVLGQIKTNEKSNEITAIPDLLEMLEINGCIITIDAMGTQKGIAEKIIDKGRDYVLALKGNQSKLHDDIELFFKGTEETGLRKPPFDYYRIVEKDHGRIEKREYFVADDTGWISSKNEWKGLRSIVMVKSERTKGGRNCQGNPFLFHELGAGREADLDGNQEPLGNRKLTALGFGRQLLRRKS